MYGNVGFSGDVVVLVLVSASMQIVRRNPLMSKRQTSYYLYVAASIFLLAALEVFEALFEISGNPAFNATNTFFNVLVLALFPFIIIGVISTFFEEYNKYMAVLMIPLYVNIFFACLTPIHGWYFIIYANGLFAEGPLYVINIGINLYTYILFIFAAITHHYKTHSEEPVLDAIPVFFMVLPLLVKIKYPDVPCAYLGAAFAIFIMYVSLGEERMRIDPLTGFRTRAEFEKNCFVQFEKTGKIFMFVFTIDFLKNINCEYGYEKGNEVLSDMAEIIEEYFGQVGSLYRSEGNEFILVPTGIDIPTDHSRIEYGLRHMAMDIRQHSSVESFPFSLTYGTAVMESETHGDSSSMYEQQDKILYVNKRLNRKARGSLNNQ